MSSAIPGASSSSSASNFHQEQTSHFATLKSQARDDIHAALELGEILVGSGEEFSQGHYQFCIEALNQAPRGPEHEEEVQKLLSQLQKKVPHAGSSSSASNPQEMRETVQHYRQRAETGEPFAILKLAHLLAEAEEDFPEADYQQCLEWLKSMPKEPVQEAEIEGLKALLEKKISPRPEKEKEPSPTENLGFGPELGDSFEELEKKAKEKDPEALYRLAICYYNGWGTGKFEPKGKYYLAEAVKCGHLEASWLFVRLKGFSCYESCVEVVRENLLAHATNSVSLSAEKLYLLGFIFAYGKNSHQRVQADLKQAVKWYQMAATMGHVEAMKCLARIYLYEESMQDKEAAFALHLKLAEKGDVKFMQAVAFDYYYERGVDRNYEKALEWCHRAEAAGSQTVFYKLGSMYFCGEGTAVNNARAAAYYKKALLYDIQTKNSRDFAIYLCSYARACQNRDEAPSDEEGFKEALTWIESSGLSVEEQAVFRAAVKERNPEMLSLIIVDGPSLGCLCSIGPGLGEYFERLKFEGERRSEAAYRLALCYYNGWGTEQSDYHGGQALNMATAQGHVEASWEHLRRDSYSIEEKILQTLSEFCVGNDALTPEQLFLMGKGYYRASPVKKQNLDQAIHWYTRAFAAGHQEAKKELLMIYRGVYYVGRSRCGENEQARFPLLVEFAEQGDVQSMKELAHAYWCGLGTSQNKHLATQWYHRAEDHAHLSEFYLGRYNTEIRREGLDYFIERRNAASYRKVATYYAEENPKAGAQKAIDLVKNSPTLTQTEKEAFFNELAQQFPDKVPSDCSCVLQ